MQLENVSHVIIDLGGVIIHIEPQRTWDSFADLVGDGFKDQFERLSVDGLFLDFETGKIDEAELQKILRCEMGITIDENEFMRRWNLMLLGIPEKVWQPLQKLNKAFPLYLLSNTNPIHYRWIVNHISNVYPDQNWNAYFSKIFLSYEMGMRKPDPEIFKEIIERENIRPESILFIDDDSKNIDTAASLGMQIILHEQNSPLVKTVERLFS